MNGKLMAIISYFTFVGWVIAFVLNLNEKNSFASFHIRQSLGLNILGILLVIIPVFGWIIGTILLVIGLFTAITDRTVPVPVVGDFFQDWFKTIGSNLF